MQIQKKSRIVFICRITLQLCWNSCSVCVALGSWCNYFDVFCYQKHCLIIIPHQLQSVLRMANLPPDFWPDLSTVKWIGVGKSRESMIQLFWEERGGPSGQTTCILLTPFSTLPLFLDFSYFYAVLCCVPSVSYLNERKAPPMFQRNGTIPRWSQIRSALSKKDSHWNLSGWSPAHCSSTYAFFVLVSCIFLVGRGGALLGGSLPWQRFPVQPSIYFDYWFRCWLGGGSLVLPGGVPRSNRWE